MVCFLPVGLAAGGGRRITGVGFGTGFGMRMYFLYL
ncbi:hypothetical protein SBA3_2310043 [Candidatus Sulfopaludibacter sp. SbA3]|nr:hypothetical protein SBA3_2310043 [Candidatus Sulfopaludibacter sp. SbA3]